MSNEAKKPFNKRAFVDIALAICALGLPVTAAGMELRPEGPGGHAAREAWGGVHGSFGLLFVVFALLHVYMNRRALWMHIKGSGGKAPISREFLVALGAVVVLMALLVVPELAEG